MSEDGYLNRAGPGIGNGLPGLPQKRTPSKMTASFLNGVGVMKPVGTPLLMDTVTGTSSAPSMSFDSAVKFGTDGVLVGWTNNDASNTYYYLALFKYAGDILTMVGSRLNVSVANQNQKLFASVMISGALYQFVGNVLYRYNDAGTALNATTVKSTCIPNSGTLTAGGAYTGANNFDILDVLRGGIQFNGQRVYASPVRESGDGNIATFIHLTVAAQTSIACFVINTSGNVVRSFVVGTIGTSASSSINMVVKSVGVGKYAVMATCPIGGPSVQAKAFNVDTIAGTSTLVGTNALGVADSSVGPVNCAWISSDNSYMRYFYIEGDTTQNVKIFGMSLNSSGFTGSMTADNMPNPGNMDSSPIHCEEFNDMFSANIQYTAPLSRLTPLLQSSLLNSVTIFSVEKVTGVDRAGVSHLQHYTLPKAMMFYNSAEVPTTLGEPYTGPDFRLRIDASTLLAVLTDTSTNVVRKYLQLYRAG